MTERTFAISDFKAKCLDILKQLGDRRIDKVTVTRHGKPVAIILPPPPAEDDLIGLYGSMRGRAFIDPDIDLTAPVFEGEILAEKGILHL
jgi:hypothetical protein